jgi:hypothetical protein
LFYGEGELNAIARTIQGEEEEGREERGGFEAM